MTQPPSSCSEVAWSATDLQRNPHEEADKARRVEAMFSAIAPHYDLNNRLHSFGRDQAWRKRAVRLCGVRREDAVLDVACGTGDLSEAFARAHPREVIGVDFSEPMLAIARRKSMRLKARQRSCVPVYQHADAMDLPFEDGRFDIVSIAFGIRNVADPARALREFRRVLRPGGRIVILEFAEPRNRLLRSLCRLYTAHIMPATASLIARDRSGAYRYLPRSVESFMSGDALMEAMRDADFALVETRPMSLGICAAYLGRVRPDSSAVPE